MGIDLSKGGRVDLSKEVPGLDNVVIGLGWDTNSSDSGVDFDLDASLFMVNEGGKCPDKGSFIFYSNLKSTDGSITHNGDNLTGEGDGDDETIDVVLSKVPANINELVIVVTIHEASTRNQNFGQVQNALIRLVNKADNKEITKYELDEDFSSETAIEFGKLYRKDGGWRFQAVGTGFNSGLEGFVTKFGL